LPEIVSNSFRGKVYNDFKIYRQDIDNYLNDQSSPNQSTGKQPMELDAVIAAAVNEAATGERSDVSENELDHAGKGESTNGGDDMIAFAANIAQKAVKAYKGKGKGDFDGKSGWQSANHYDPYRSGGWKGQGKNDKGGYGRWQKGEGNGGKGYVDGKGKGKTKGKPQIQCFNCKGWGHRKVDCPSVKVINGLSEESHEEDEEEAAWLLEEDVADQCTPCKGVEEGWSDLKNKKSKKTERKSEEQETHSETLMVVEEVKGKWVRVSAGVDSCASNTVIPVNMFPKIEKKETEQSKAGKNFTAANGEKIPNEGEKMIPFCTEDGDNRRVRAQIAKVTRMLISASKMTKAGYKVNLSVDNPYVQSMKTGKVTPLRHKNGIFLIDLWINTEVTGPVFSRQGS